MEASTPTRIVVGIDGSAASERALRWALEEARYRQGAVAVVHAWEYPTMALTPYGGTAVPVLTPSDLERVAETLAHEVVASVVGESPPVPVETLVRRGHPAEVLVEAAKGADLLVVGSRGRGGFTGMLLGSVSTQVVHHATCPVVIVKPPPGE